MVTELRDGIFYADLVLRSNGTEIVISSRPSDAIALAARTGSPIFVFPAVLQEAGVEIHDEDSRLAARRASPARFPQGLLTTAMRAI